jgi:hypothetical protein
MKLRRLCNHGTLQAATTGCSTSSRMRQISRKEQNSNSGELFCEFCGGDEDIAILTDGLEMCPECSRCLGSQEASGPQPSTNGLTPASQPSSLSLSASGSQNSTPQPPSPMSPNSFGFQAGHSSKLTAVTDNIQKSLHDSKK